VLLSLLLAFVLSACSGTRELGPTAFIDADTTDYIKDERDFPELGKYDNAPPVSPRPSNVLDLVKSLPETVRQFRNRDDVAEESDGAEMISADVPAEKPEPVVEETPAPDVPANDIAKSLIGDLSSNTYTDPVRSDDFEPVADNDVFEPVPVQIVNLPDTPEFAPQLVVPKTLSAPKAYTLKGMMPAGRDLAMLRQSVYLAKLTQSSARAVNNTVPLQFAQSSVPITIMTAAREQQSPPKISITQNTSVTGDTGFVVLGRINADGLIVSASSQTTVLEEDNLSDDQAESLAQVTSPSGLPQQADSFADPAEGADWETIALLTEPTASATSVGFAAR